MPLLQAGQTIRGTYEVERFLGAGAFAEVYRVRHRFLGRQAMKVFKAAGMTVEETEALLEEAVLLSRLGHPNIVRVFDANVTETAGGMSGYFTMEYVAGGTLEQFWRSHGHQFVPVATSVDIARQVCRGLAVAHGENPPIVHRDIKPQNLLAGYDSGGLRIKVSDFGLAKHVNPLTLRATARGTRAFKPPEAFAQAAGDSVAGDVWALGSVLYLLLTDRLPFAQVGDSEEESAAKFRRPLIPPSQLNVRVDPGLEQIAYRALAPNVDDRYPNTQELLTDLEAWAPADDDAMLRYASDLSDDSKAALGAHSPKDDERAAKLTRQATELARRAGKLMEAADLMEEALNLDPSLRDAHEYQLKLWRRGVVM